MRVYQQWATHTDPQTIAIPTAYDLEQNYPNPFHSTTTLSFSMPEAEHVILDIFDATGRKMDTLIDADRQPGTYQVIFDGEKYSPGLYTYRIRAGEYQNTKHMMLSEH